MITQALTRAHLAAHEIDAAAAPVRIVHLGLGNFFRAHQAWYTAHADDATEWGIAAFTGRSPAAADALSAQDGLYCLVVRGADGDTVEVIPSVSEVHPASDVARLIELISNPTVAIVTLTITESGYHLLADGTPDPADAELEADIRMLRSGRAPSSTVCRLLYGLTARRSRNGGPIAVVSCDNIPGNGAFLRRGMVALAAALDSDLASWIEQNVSFVCTSVDRITPRAGVDIAAVAESGWSDVSPVVTEPFTDWVLQGDFPAGRPRWESAGARFVDDIEPWEQRKLWLLNGAHSILAFTGLTRGMVTVSDAVADAACRGLVTAFWAEAVTCLRPGIEYARYLEQLLDRFANPRIAHSLTQIATDSTTKVRYRITSVAERIVGAGGSADACAAVLRAWIDWVHRQTVHRDARTEEAASAEDPVRALVTLVSPRLASDARFLQRVRHTGAPSLSEIPPSPMVAP